MKNGLLKAMCLKSARSELEWFPADELKRGCWATAMTTINSVISSPSFHYTIYLDGRLIHIVDGGLLESHARF